MSRLAVEQLSKLNRAYAVMPRFLEVENLIAFLGTVYTNGGTQGLSSSGARLLIALLEDLENCEAGCGALYAEYMDNIFGLATFSLLGNTFPEFFWQLQMCDMSFSFSSYGNRGRASHAVFQNGFLVWLFVKFAVVIVILSFWPICRFCKGRKALLFVSGHVMYVTGFEPTT